MKRVASAAAIAALFAIAAGSAFANEQPQQLGGTCGVRGPVHSSMVSLWLRYERVDGSEHSSYSTENDVPVTSLRGFSPGDLDGGSVHKFTVSSDAGDVVCSAIGGHGEMGGTFDFVPSARFNDELRKRGMSAASSEDQLRLALSHFKLATLDALLRGGFQRPTTGDLVRLTDHGITDDYISGMQQLRLVPKTVDGLVRMRDHGVTLDYARTMLQNYPGSSVDDLVRARDHGVSLRYASAMRRDWGNASLNDLVQLVDHGVSETYMAQLAQMGYRPSASDAVRLADHGVTPAYIERLRKHGYTKLSIEDLIRLRDSGV